MKVFENLLCPSEFILRLSEEPTHSLFLPSQSNHNAAISSARILDEVNNDGQNDVMEIVYSKPQEDPVLNDSGTDEDRRRERDDSQISKEKGQNIGISLNDIKDKEFPGRKELSLFIRKWAILQQFRVIFRTREQVLQSKIKVSILHCQYHECPFFLEFRTPENSDMYALDKFWDIHTHSLEEQFGALNFTPVMLEKLREFRAITEDTAKITKAFNKHFDLDIKVRTLWYQLSKMRNLEIGHPTQDAKLLIDLLKKDKQERNTYFEHEHQNQRLIHFSFMTNRMKCLANKFNDVYIIDASHKTNRFGMPLFDVVCINNLGKTCTVFIALLKSHKYEEFLWALNCNLNDFPLVIFSDEEDLLRKGFVFSFIL